MTIKIASDIHGSFAELHAQLEPTDTLILLGDYIDLIDYNDLSGMISEFVPKPIIRKILDLIAEGKLVEAKTEMDSVSMNKSQLFRNIEKLSHERYETLFSGLPCQTYLIWGNVDFPEILKEHLKANTHLVIDSVLSIDDRTCGLVSGSPPMRYSFGMPGELTREQFRNRLYSIGPVDHLFVHPPPSIQDLTYDVSAQRDEEGSEDLLAYIEAYEPRTVHFGHVHEPRVLSMMYNEKTELVNVGHFHQTKTLLEM